MSTKVIAMTIRPTSEQVAALELLQRQFYAACDFISAVAWREREWNAYRLQGLIYGVVRSRFGLMAQYTVRAIAVVAKSYKTERTCRHTFRPDAAVVLDTPACMA